MVIEQSHLIEQGAAMYVVNMHNPRHHHHRHHHHHHLLNHTKCAISENGAPKCAQIPRISENGVDVLDKNGMIQDASPDASKWLVTFGTLGRVAAKQRSGTAKPTETFVTSLAQTLTTRKTNHQCKSETINHQLWMNISSPMFYV